ncbi:MAG: hypothetical protein Q4D85_04080 [Corynebacterium sp.]|uniref:hypothetical protein n=1 Tax=Corynebacterium sp. TaxID=1720 RepID=UPI0026DD5D95|nr:hypothetical protein [Corynebacterium sp.]MDO5097914.1 hypothetical protein [Corynebacterium sp.]
MGFANPTEAGLADHSDVLTPRQFSFGLTFFPSALITIAINKYTAVFYAGFLEVGDCV